MSHTLEEMNGATCSIRPHAHRGKIARWKAHADRSCALTSIWLVSDGPYEGILVHWRILLHSAKRRLSCREARVTMMALAALGLDCKQLLGFDGTDLIGRPDAQQIKVNPIGYDDIMYAVAARLDSAGEIQALLAVNRYQDVIVEEPLGFYS